MKKVWIGTGWKMNHLLAEAREYAQKLNSFIQQEKPQASIFICPPFTALSAVAQELKSSPVHIASQNIHWLDRAAATGEISPLMVKDAGADMVEIGHSERKAAFGENDLTVNLKVKAALQHELIPLICVGDSAFEKENGVSQETLIKQVKIALHGISPEEVSRLILAYEPVWAIGESGVPATPEFANSIQQQIRNSLCVMFGETIGKSIPILYGGSVNQDNALALIAQPSIDGLFIGRAAWKADGFISIIRSVVEFVHKN
ncbi:MAG TPA: triose-phosphate isomerase [Anaerolineaceae bacterium]|nr:triose-phosphate isomerase [Anaerolineaceae bacterium]